MTEIFSVDVDAVKRTLNRQGPDCKDFWTGHNRDLKTWLEKLLAALEDADKWEDHDINEILKLETELSELKGKLLLMGEVWRPIGTAPLDETTVDLWLVGTPWPDKPETNIGYRLTDCWYCPGEKAWVRTGFFDEIEKIEGDGLQITHWMLPLLPKKEVVAKQSVSLRYPDDFSAGKKISFGAGNKKEVE